MEVEETQKDGVLERRGYVGVEGWIHSAHKMYKCRLRNIFVTVSTNFLYSNARLTSREEAKDSAVSPAAFTASLSVPEASKS